jgi:hypothetical protein
MPRYFLHVRVGGRHIEDTEGVDAPHVDATLEEVVRAAREFLDEGLLNGGLTTDDRFEITDEAGDVLATVPLTRELASGTVDLERLTGFSYKRH